MADASDAFPAFFDQVPPDRYCDLILNGGITSAVAYPAAVFALAQAYRFNAIGGASSGAGIAAVAAAAEYRRRHGSTQGYDRMARRIRALADEREGNANLSRLFQPNPGQRRLFRAILRAMALPDDKVHNLMVDTVSAYRAPLLTGVAVGLTLVAYVSWQCCTQGILAYFAVALLLCGPAALLGAVAADLFALADQHYGLCSGHAQGAAAGEAPASDKPPVQGGDSADPPPLTDWLHELIQDCAGRQAEGAPLTFADLHGAPGSPRETWGDCSASGDQSIRLEIVAAAVTLGEPLRFPRRKEDTTLYFCVEEWERLFPKAVIEHLTANSPGQPYTGPVLRRRTGGFPRQPTFRELPRLDLPVIVAARMSIAFPFVLEPVPLWRVDKSAPQRGLAGKLDYKKCHPTLRRCLVFDGGLCSNFPIHLFDSLVPAWPTFGVQLWDLDVVHDLRPKSVPPESRPDPLVELPRRGNGRWPLWDRFDEADEPADRVGGLLRAMFSTIRDWTDSAQARLPGVRDRVVAIGLPPGIGGLNVLMTGAQIRMLAERGGDAARRLLEHFGKPDARTGRPSGWDEHRLMRFRLAVDSLRRAAEGVTLAANTNRHATPLRELLAERRRAALAADAVGTADRAFSTRLRADQSAALDAALCLLEHLESDLQRCDTALDPSPAPTPELRVRPPM